MKVWFHAFFYLLPIFFPKRNGHSHGGQFPEFLWCRMFWLRELVALRNLALTRGHAATTRDLGESTEFHIEFPHTSSARSETCPQSSELILYIARLENNDLLSQVWIGFVKSYNSVHVILHVHAEEYQ